MRDTHSEPDASELLSEKTRSKARRQRRAKRELWVLRIIIIVALLVGIGAIGLPMAWQGMSAKQQASTITTADETVANWPYPQAKIALQKARKYNRRLLAQHQPMLGEASDPFSSLAGASRATQNDGNDTIAAKDKEYNSLLDQGSGVMGAIRIPKISVNLPIRHGSSEDTLALGAGHLYGSSLPVGGKGTHAVITAHRGLPSAAMFTRLDEMRKGDFFYISTMGETLAYEVDRISMIEPTDTSKLKIKAGEDRITLMTCTPYGVNTHRLLVSGHRTTMPIPAPNPKDLLDPRKTAFWITSSIVAIGFVGISIAGRRRIIRDGTMRHSTRVLLGAHRGLHSGSHAR